jgi:hypothetical protein
MTLAGLCLRNGCRNRWTRTVLMAAAAWLVVSLGALSFGTLSFGTLSFGTSLCFADEPDEEDDAKEVNKAKFQAMIDAFDDVEITVGEDREPLKFNKTPVVRWTNITGGTIVAGTFIWTKDERPEVIACLYDWQQRGEIWFGFQSLSSPNLVAKKGGGTLWRSEKPDVEFIKLDGAAVPADSPVKRLSQMKESAERFRARVYVHTVGGTEELRLLTTPLYRYKSGATIDGALFAFVMGTDPEVILHLEANRRKTDAGEVTEWQYAISRRSGRALEAKLDDKQIWSAELSRGAPNQPWYEAPLGQ